MIPLKAFGRTGHNSTRTIFGAFALSELTQYEADKVLETVLEFGINHIDTAQSYGQSEQRLGPWMKHHRDKFFLATKTDKRTYKEAKEELHQSLEKLNTDHIDLWQMHYLVAPDQWKTAMNEGGVLQAFVEAKAEGLVSNLGVTGHGLAAPEMHLKSLEAYDFDSVLLPYNFMIMQNDRYAAAFNNLAEVCAKKNVAMQTIKSLAKGKKDSSPARHNVWYQPIENDEAIKKSVDWVLGNEQFFLNTSGDVGLMTKILKAASKLGKRPSDTEMLESIKQNEISQLFTGDLE